MATASRATSVRPRTAVAMRKCDWIDLTEHKESEPIPLSPAEHDAIRRAVPSINITRVEDSENEYTLTPGSTIGALEIGDLSIHIQPKLGIQRVLWLACYALGAFRLRSEQFTFKSDQPELVSVLAQALGDAAGKAFARGLLHGYRVEEEALHTVRGRIMVAEQIRRRFDMPLPVEVRYDEWTEDILANRLIKAAARLLGRMRLSEEARHGLRHINATLDNVMPVRFPPHDVPKVKFDRLNAHYEEVVTLARLVLAHQSFEPSRDGKVRARGFLVDMNKVFEGFLVRDLRRSLGVSEHTLRQGKTVRTLAEGGKFELKPDLSWWDDRYGCYTFVGDAKYKRIEAGVRNADVYQALAYATALDLPGALLAYAKGEMGDLAPASYTVRNANKRIEVAAVDLTGDIPSIHASIDALAERVRCLRAEGRQRREAQPAQRQTA